MLNARRLWSLWDMLALNADQFYLVSLTLRRLKLKIEGGSDDEKGAALTGGQKDTLSPFIAALVEQLEKLGTKVTLIAAKRLSERLTDQNKDTTHQHVAECITHIEDTLKDELSLCKVYVIEENKHAFFDGAMTLFGADVQAKFPSISYEIDEAAKCIALSRDTAAVFHFMRALEVAIRAVATCLNVPDPVKPAEKNWAIILRKVKEAMDAKDAKPATAATPAVPASWNAGDASLFDEMYALLDSVKGAWRNSTMHVESKYTSDEAEQVMVAVKGFMKKLAARMDENGDPKA